MRVRNKDEVAEGSLYMYIAGEVYNDLISLINEFVIVTFAEATFIMTDLT